MSQQPTQTEAIKRFLEKNTYQELSNLYHHDMEVQVIVRQGNGTKINQEFKGRQYHAYTNNIETWYPIRIPKNANNNPQYEDKIMSYNLGEYVEGIGLTGWNWKEKKSIYVGFDFDALLGHSEKHTKKLTSHELNEITNRLYQIPYCTIRKSTSGKGLHLYIFINQNQEINTHTEHAALARAILGQLSAEVNYDFSTKVDTCGGVLWIYHRKMIGTDGLELIKQGTELNYIPSNWKDHVQVVNGRRIKVLPDLIINEQENTFDLITGQRNKIKLDKEHYRLLDYLKTIKYNSYWDSDRWMLVTHTYALKLAHEALGFKGKYNTISEGTDPTQNCFAFALPHGGWVIRRFSPGVAETITWEQDKQGYTKCYFNCNPDVHIAAKSHGGMENKSGAYIFNDLDGIIKACQDLNIDLELPGRMLERKARMKYISTSSRLIIEIEYNANKDSAIEMEGWFQEGKWWQRIFTINRPNQESDIFNYDDTIRHIISQDNKDLGWYVKSTDGIWHSEPLIHIRSILEGPYGYSPKEAKIILGSNIIKPWIIVNQPFEVEYPGERLWNQNSAQFRFPPSNVENPTYSTWSKIFNHLGKNLNHACQQNQWCQQNGILTGADYLFIWVASVFQQPYEPLPYLFLYGPENSGKSIFHEALSLILTNGYVRADSTLKSSSNFNGELLGAIICIVEETHLKRDKNAAAKIKDWTTALQLPLHIKGKTPYLVPNTTHWVQCVPHNTWILTSKGPKQVKDLISNPFIAIVDGRKYQTNGFSYTGYKEVFEIETYEGHTLQCTANHKILTHYLDLINIWQEVSNLKEGNTIHLHNHSNIEWNGEGNFDEGYILGLLVGDGSFRERAERNDFDPVLYFYTDEDKKLIPYIIKTLDNCNLCERKDNTLTIAGKQLKELCKQFGLYNKDIESLENTSSDFYCGFLSGFFDTDGSCPISAYRVVLYQSDLERLQIVQRMLLRLGIVSKISISRNEKESIIYNNKNKTYSKKAYQLQITNKENLQRFQTKINFKLQYKADNLDIIINSWTRKDIDVKYKARIKSIRSIGFKDVYDTQVETVHAFDANGFMVHNCSNDFDSCPIFEGDSRITMIKVNPLEDNEIPKREMKKLLEKEAPDFITKIKSLELPHPIGRLGIPILNTEDKKHLQQSNRTPLEIFLEEKCHYAPGKSILYSELYQEFKRDLDSQECIYWTIRMLGKNLPPQYPKGRLVGSDPNWRIGNISLSRPTEDELKQPKYILKDQYLVLESKLTEPKLIEQMNGEVK